MVLQPADKASHRIIVAHIANAMALSMSIALPAGPRMSDLASASLLPDKVTAPIIRMRSPTCKCLLALPFGAKEMISNPPSADGIIVAPMPVRLPEEAGAGSALMEMNLEIQT